MVALVDSGADCSLFDVGYADLLGLNREEANHQEGYVAGGDTIKTYRWPTNPLELQFESHRFAFEGSFVDFANADSVNLLGRRDFFGQFTIQFWDAQRLMNIDLSPDFPRGDATSQL